MAAPAPRRPVIITCAITGAVHTPSMTPHLPITPQQIADEAVAAAAAGAAIIHLHARDPHDGRPTADPALYGEFLPAIRARCDAVLAITTGGGQNMTVQERLAAALEFAPEMCSLNMGSMNFGLYPALSRHTAFAHDWERPYLEGSRDYIFRNTFADLEYILRTLGERTRFEFECYDIGHLYTLAHLLDRGLVRPPLFVQMIFGILGGMGADPENLLHMRRIAQSLFGDQVEWSVLAAGRHQMALATMAGICGGSVRVGLEDSIYLAKGRLATSNAEQVTKIRRILDELSLPVASPAEVRQRLAVKGAAAVAY
ncbi:MAG: 3-keto-5-aminohexanoate cleavage protein [Vicinamibacterales bacterium]